MTALLLFTRNWGIVAYCIQERIQEAIGAIARAKPTKVTLFIMILYNSEKSIGDVRHFTVHCFVTAVL